MTFDNLLVALRGLLANRMRSILTMLGILIGTAAVILLVAVGTGISNLVQHQIETLGSNAVYVLPERNRGPQSNGGTNARRIQLTKADVKALSDKARAPDISAVAPAVGTSGTVTWEGITYALQNFIGAEPIYGAIRNATVSSGRFFDDGDEAEHAKVAVVGTTVVEHVFGKGVNPVGQEVQFNNVIVRIVGVLDHKGSNGFQDQDDVMIAPLSTVIDDLVGNVDSYTVIAVQAPSRLQTNAAQAEATAVLRQTHHLRRTDPADFTVFNQASLLNAGQQAARVFQLLLAAVASISLLVGGIGVMNIMLVTVTERTREIGIRKALGAQRSDILGQFLAEATLLAALGGLLGVACGIGVSNLHMGKLHPVVSPAAVILSFGVSALVGVFFGLYPASRAAKLRPIEALRFE